MIVDYNERRAAIANIDYSYKDGGGLLFMVIVGVVMVPLFLFWGGVFISLPFFLGLELWWTPLASVIFFGLSFGFFHEAHKSWQDYRTGPVRLTGTITQKRRFDAGEGGYSCEITLGGMVIGDVPEIAFDNLREGDSVKVRYYPKVKGINRISLVSAAE